MEEVKEIIEETLSIIDSEEEIELSSEMLEEFSSGKEEGEEDE